MNIIFFFILFFHGIIHLMGFVKAFKIAEFEQLSHDISQPAGIFWLLAAILLTGSAILFITRISWWHLAAVAGVVVSSVLIANVWSDAKFGMIANAIVLIGAAISIGSGSLQKMAERERNAIFSEVSGRDQKIISRDDISGLPVPVQRWMVQSGVLGKPEIHTVILSQKALMKMKPEQTKWHKAEARQWITTQKPSFVWTVKMDMSPVMKIAGRDKFADGRGEMLIRMNGLINVVNEKGEKMDEGTLQRFLGEMVWYPSAALSEYISWETIDINTARATMNWNGTKGSGIFCFDENGRFKSFSAMRFMGNAPDAKRYEWVINAKESAEFGNIRIPSKLEATWKLDQGDWTWLQLEITDAKFNVENF